MFNRINLTDHTTLPAHMPRLRFEEGASAGAAPAATPPAAATPAAQAPAAPAVAPVAPVAPPPAAAQLGAAEKVEDLPAWAQKLIGETRTEAATNRVKATSAETQAQAILTAVAKAAGIEIPGEKPDPEKLAADLTAAQQMAKDTAIQLAVFKAAGTHQGNPDALLDSTSFLTKVKSLDPNGANFATDVSEAIKAAVAANPSLKAARAAGASSVDTSSGTGELGQITEAQLAQMTPEQIVEAQKKGLLRDLLG